MIRGTRGSTPYTNEEAQANGILERCTPAPHPTRATRTMWRADEQPNDPIAHITNDLYMIGGLLNEHFQILIHNEAPEDINAVPYQYLSYTILETAGRARTKAAEGTKVKKSGLEEIDAIANKSSHSKMTEKDISFLQTYQTGSGWSTDKLKEAGIMEENTCSHCGGSHSGNNLIWECNHPQLVKNQIETDHEIAALDLKHLPNSIRRGIAPAMSHQPEDTFWGTQQKDLNQAHSKLIGIREGRADSYHAMGLIEKAKLIKVNARQLISTLRGGHGIGQTPDYPQDIQGTPPKKPNGYIDGGVKNPKSSAWQMAVYGMWWPDPPSESENEQMTRYTFQQTVAQGTMMWGSMVGQHAHSTRTEHAALLIAMLSPIPLNIATDSQAMMDKAEYLINQAILWQLKMGTDQWTTATPCGKAWGLQKDGDLWEVFWAASLLRGPRTLKLTKVKSHCGLKDVKAGVITEEDRRGNGHADDAATAGTDQHFPGLLRLASWLAQRHQDYCSFMTRVHKYIISVSQKEKEIREEISKERRQAQNLKKNQKPLVRVQHRIPQQEGNEAKNVLYLHAQRGKHKPSSHQSMVDAIHQFIKVTVCVEPQVDSQSAKGTTWAEYSSLST